MRSKPTVLIVLIVLIVASALGAGAALGQAPGGGQLLLLHQEVAKPSAAMQYESTSQEFRTMVLRNQANMPHFTYTCVLGDDLVYTYAVPLANYGAIDAVNQEFGILAQKEGDKFADVSKRSGATVDHYQEWIVQEQPEISYQPAAPRLKREEMKYFRYDVYHVMPEKEGDADALAKDFLALYKSRNIATGYRVFKPVLGPDMPAIIVEVGAKDAADFATQDAKDSAALGEAAKPLFARAMGISRRVEHKSAWLRPDLSVMPPAPATKK